MKLEEIQQGKTIAGVVPGKLVRVVAAEMRGDGALELVYSVEGSLGQRRLSRADEDGLLLTSNQTWWRRADPKVLAMLVLLIGALGVYKFLTWSTPDTDGPVSNDMPVFIRTNGGMLEVGTVKHRRTFNLTNTFFILGYTLPFCKESASYTVDTYITYRIKLAKNWAAAYRNQRLELTAPRLEPALPVAFDTSKLRSTFQKCAMMPSLATQNELLRRISGTLEKDALNPRRIQFARDNGARDSVREFAQKWLINQKDYKFPANVQIDVKFDDE